MVARNTPPTAKALSSVRGGGKGASSSGSRRGEAGERKLSLTRTTALLAATVGGTALLMALIDAAFGFVCPAPLGVAQIGVGTAVALIGSAAALQLVEKPVAGANPRWRMAVASLLATAVLLFGLFYLARYSTGVTLTEGDFVSSARRLFSVAPGGALGFAFYGLALLLLDARTRFQRILSTLLTLAAAAVALLALLGHLLHALTFRDVGSAYSPMMPGTAVTMAMLCLGLLAARPEREPMATVASRTPGGVTARRLLLAVLVVPLLGWLRLLGQQVGLYEVNAGSVVFSATTMCGFAVLIWWNARRQRFLEADRTRAERALRESEERYRLLFENNPLPMWIYDSETLRFLDVNDASLEHYGYTREEFLSRTILDIRPDEDGSEVRRTANDSFWVRRGRRYSGHWRHRKKDGTIISVEVTSIDSTFATEGRPSRLVLASDVTERERAEAQVRRYSQELEAQKRELQAANERLHAQATRDGLTGLYNHRVFYERLAEAQEEAARYNYPLSLLLLDVDRFKSFNDDLGHPEGDRVLQTVGRILEAGSRGSDIVARYGGEEFAVLLPHADAQSAARAAERLRLAVEQFPWSVRPVTVSIGIATLGPQMPDGRALVRAADTALYTSKREGRNRITSADLPLPLDPALTVRDIETLLL